MKLSRLANHLDAVRQGEGLLAHCPAHGDSHRSLRVDVTKEGKLLVHCRAGCPGRDVLGALPSWVELEGVEVDMDGIDFARGAQAGPVDAVTQAQMAAYLTEAATNDHDGLAAEYAADRFGIDEKSFRALGLGFDPGGPTSYPFLGAMYTDAPRLVVPFHDAEGIPRGFQARDIGPGQTAKAKWSGPKNPLEGQWARAAFFEAGAGIDAVAITEGPGDALTSTAAGVDSVGIRGVANAPAVVAELVAALAGRKVILAGDNDRAGKGMNRALGDALTEAGLTVHVLELPEDVEDISHWFETHRETFVEDYQRAVIQAPRYHTETPAEAAPDSGSELDLASHVGVARRVVELFDGGVCYAAGLGFFIYRDGAWRRDRTQEVRRAIHTISDEFERLGLELDGTDEGTKYAQASKRLRSTPYIDNVLKELKALAPIDLEEFDQHHHLLNFRNGVVDLRSGEMLEHSKGYLLTTQLEFDYDPEAEAPRWEQFLAEIMPDQPDMVPFLQRLVGYGVTGETSEQCFAVLWGTGANGKSIFTDTLAYVFEDLSETTPFSTFEERASGGIPNDLAALRGSRLVFASEGDRGKPMAESIIKRVTGQDLISARFMREEFFSFRPTFLIMLASNHKPRFKSQDEGLWRRVKFIPFARYFADHERDYHLGDKLKAEAPGIAAWAVAGAVQWYRDGLGDPHAVEDATKNYRQTSDALWGFFPGVYEPGSADQWAWGADIYTDYEKWCDAEGLSGGETWRRTTFYEGMEERGCLRVRGSKGVKLTYIRRVGAEAETPAPSSDRQTIFDQGESK